jgi:hypothetical protein
VTDTTTPFFLDHDNGSVKATTVAAIVASARVSTNVGEGLYAATLGSPRTTRSLSLDAASRRAARPS